MKGSQGACFLNYICDPRDSTEHCDICFKIGLGLG